MSRQPPSQSASRPAQPAQPATRPTDSVIGNQLQRAPDPLADHSSPTKDGGVLQMGEQTASAGRARELNIAVERVPVGVGPTASCRLDVRTAAGNALEVTLEQLLYRKAFTGDGTVSTSN